jgi:hypothetical protein
MLRVVAALHAIDGSRATFHDGSGALQVFADTQNFKVGEQLGV